MIPSDVRRDLLDRHQVVAVSPLQPGFSGASVFRCEATPPLVLKRWPDQVPLKRIEQVHAIVSSLANVCQWVPAYRGHGPHDNTPYIDSSGSVWELATWMPGKPLAYDASVTEIRRGAEAIRRVHEHLNERGHERRRPPAIQERIDRIAQLNRVLPRCWQLDLRGQVHPSVFSAVRRATSVLQSDWNAKSAHFSDQLSRLNSEHPVQYVLRDIHREHLLFENGQPSGIIDFDAIRVDTPATDLARWATGFEAYCRDPARVVAEVLAGYLGCSPLFSGEPSSLRVVQTVTDSPTIGAVQDASFPSLIGELARSSVWISLANWVAWIVIDRRRFSDYQMVARRMMRLLDAVDH